MKTVRLLALYGCSTLLILLGVLMTKHNSIYIASSIALIIGGLLAMPVVGNTLIKQYGVLQDNNSRILWLISNTFIIYGLVTMILLIISLKINTSLSHRIDGLYFARDKH